jgi:hypothetical protein
MAALCPTPDGVSRFQRPREDKTMSVIYSDDPQAVEKLTAKIESLQAMQERMKKENRDVRKVMKASNELESRLLHLVDLGYEQSYAAELLREDFCGRVGHPDYALQNNNANINRLKKRLKMLEDKPTESSEEQHGDVRIVQNVEAHRVQIFFPGKPDADVRSELKSHGFKWAPSEGAWQRHLGTNALWLARKIVEENCTEEVA